MIDVSVMNCESSSFSTDSEIGFQSNNYTNAKKHWARIVSIDSFQNQQSIPSEQEE